MTPATVHLLAQLIRHARGMLTAWETWLASQPERTQQLIQVSRQARRAFMLFERWLSEQPADTSAETPATTVR